MNEQPLKVSELVSCIKLQLENEFSSLWIEGEVSNLSQSATGHWYFNISDQESSLPCCLFKNMVGKNPSIYSIKDGQKVSIRGKLSVYAKRTSVQVIASEITVLKDQGDLKQKFEKLKSNLAKEGLFDIDKKKKIPRYVKNIALITSERGAVLQDILSVMKRRSIEYKIHIYPSVVQGDTAPQSIISSINLVEKKGGYDVLILARGGGSQEDLWCFNDEALIRRIAEIKIPTVSAIGHETDFTLCDFVADLRAETPTAAAEILSTGQLKLKEQFSLLQHSLKSYGVKKLQYIKYLRHSITPSYQLGLVKEILYKLKNKFSALKPQSYFLSKLLDDKKMRLDEILDRVSEINSEKLMKTKIQLDQAMIKINALSPYKVLERGYAIVTKENGKAITRNKEFLSINKTEHVLIKFADGVSIVKRE